MEKTAGSSGKRLVVATILGAQGVRGDVRLRVFAEDPAGLSRLGSLRYGETGETLRLRHIRSARDTEIYHFDGVDDRDAAEALKGRELTVARDRLPEPEPENFYLADLVGMLALAPSGERIGTVSGIANHGAEDLVDLLLDQAVPVFGRHVMLPFRRALVPDVRPETGEMIVDLDAWLAEQREDKR